jgi:hypothetical protein
MFDDDQLMPWCRATIRDGSVTLNPWTPQLIRSGPVSMALERLHETGTALADLYAQGDPGDEELLVRYVGRTGTGASDEALLGWAGTVGYRRVWLPGRVEDLDVAAADAGGLAETACRTCGLAWRDDTPEFWASVRQSGAFPGFCLACGSSLPEWTPRPGGGDQVSRKVGRERTKAAASARRPAT